MKKLLKRRSGSRQILKFDLKTKLNTLFFFIAFCTLQAKTAYSLTSDISSVNEFVGKVENEAKCEKGELTLEKLSGIACQWRASAIKWKTRII